MDKDINIESCSCTVIHQETIDMAAKNMIPDNYVMDLAELFKVFGDGTRIKILNALFSAEMCVCDISSLLGMTQSAISHQLKVLRQVRLVKYRRDGKVIYYSLDDDHVKQIFDQGLVHVKER